MQSGNLNVSFDANANESKDTDENANVTDTGQRTFCSASVGLTCLKDFRRKLPVELGLVVGLLNWSCHKEATSISPFLSPLPPSPIPLHHLISVIIAISAHALSMHFAHCHH